MKSQTSAMLFFSGRKYSIIRGLLFLEVLTLSVVGTAVSAATIGFSGLSGDFASPFTAYTESGFSVVPAPRNWIDWGYGQPEPAIVFERFAADPTITDTIKVTHDGTRFNFGSVDLYSSITAIPYIFTGLLDSKTVFTVEGTVPRTRVNYETMLNPLILQPH